MKILYAEDDRDLSKGITELLKRNHFTVEPVYDGAEALEYLLNDTYDGIILDIMMPKLDGIEVLKELRKKKISTPVLLLTAKAEIDDKVTGLDSGADDYLTKPFSTRELLARVRALTRRADVQPALAYSFGNVVLLPDTFEITSTGGKIRLPNKEYQIMEMLMANPNKLISTERFMEKIWGFDSSSELTVVWTTISYLRKKLKAIGADIGIKSNKGTGYILEELL